MGEKLSDLKPLIQPVDNGYAVKSVVIPFERFVDAQVCLGPEMRSTGEVMGQGASFEEAYARAQIASGKALPVNGPVLIAASEHLVSEALSVVDVFRSHGTEVIVTSEVADSFDPMNADAEIIDLTNWRIEDIAAWMKKANVKRVVSLSPFDKLCPVQAKVRRAAVGQAIPLSMTTRDAIGVSQATMTVSKMTLQLKAIQERGVAAPQPQFAGAPAMPVGQFSI
jgi:carbamoyl-phosphate synthase large subunit